jgi:hypothetical protein
MNPDNLPTMDANLLLSIVNMKLRNDFASLQDLSRYYDLDAAVIEQKLAMIGYRYSAQQNQFTAA